MEVKLDDKDGKLYSRLFVSSRDLGFAAYCVGFVLKKGWHYKPWEKRGSVYLQQSAFMSALATAYARPFTRSYGWPSFPEELIRFSTEESELHKRMIDQRNSIYAHSDSKCYSVKPWRAEDFSTNIVGAPELRISAEEAALLREMICKLQASIRNRMEELVPAAKALSLIHI